MTLRLNHIALSYAQSELIEIMVQIACEEKVDRDLKEWVLAYKDRGKKHVQQINAAQAIRICMEFYKRVKANVMNIEKLIGRYLQPVRPDRHFKRKMRGQTAEFFVYR